MVFTYFLLKTGLHGTVLLLVNLPEYLLAEVQEKPHIISFQNSLFTESVSNVMSHQVLRLPILTSV